MLVDIILYVILAFFGCFTLIPIGNENSTVRRMPVITFSIMALNVIIYFVTLPGLADQQRELVNAATKVQSFIESNRKMLADENVRNRLKEQGFISEEEEEEIKQQFKQEPGLEAQYATWLRGSEATILREEFTQLMKEFSAAAKDHLYLKYGLAPHGNWKFYQLITSAFLHAGIFHLFGNLIFFFAVGFSLEDLWGRGTFLAFYLMGAVASALPSIIDTSSGLIGASGAISATMGAFLIRLYYSKVIIRWITLAFALPFMLIGRKPFGRILVAAYLYIPFYFLTQVLTVWFNNRMGITDGTAYSAHFAGFLFGVVFALVMKATKAEEKYIHPKIEAKVSFSAAPVVTQALGVLDKGDSVAAERMLKSNLIKSPNDVDLIMALIQIYQHTSNYDQLNAMYGRLIRHHLSKQDKEAALYAYDNLLSSFPDNHLDVRIPSRDWLAVCEYLVEVNMVKEASVEYERLANTYTDDPLTVRVCVQGGEAALAVHDNQRALRLFEKAQKIGSFSGFSSRVAAGLDKCKLRLNNRPNWATNPPKAHGVDDTIDKQPVRS